MAERKIPLLSPAQRAAAGNTPITPQSYLRTPAPPRSFITTSSPESGLARAFGRGREMLRYLSPINTPHVPNPEISRYNPYERPGHWYGTRPPRSRAEHKELEEYKFGRNTPNSTPNSRPTVSRTPSTPSQPTDPTIPPSSTSSASVREQQLSTMQEELANSSRALDEMDATLDSTINDIESFIAEHSGMSDFPTSTPNPLVKVTLDDLKSTEQGFARTIAIDAVEEDVGTAVGEDVAAAIAEDVGGYSAFQEATGAVALAVLAYQAYEVGEDVIKEEEPKSRQIAPIKTIIPTTADSLSNSVSYDSRIQY